MEHSPTCRPALEDPADSIPPISLRAVTTALHARIVDLLGDRRRSEGLPWVRQQNRQDLRETIHAWRGLRAIELGFQTSEAFVAWRRDGCPPIDHEEIEDITVPNPEA